MLFSVSKHKKTSICLTEEILLLDKLHLGRGYSATGHELTFNKATIYILNKASLNRNIHKTWLCIDQVTNVTRDLQKTNPVYSLETMVQYSQS